MKQQAKWFSLLLLGALALMLVSACGASPAQADSHTPAEEPRTITVTGTGTAYGSPDLATAQIGVQTRNADPGQAMTENNQKMAAITAALTGMGIAENDIQTTNFSVYAQQEFDKRTGQELDAITYVVDNTLNVTVRDVARLGDVLSGAVDAGANSLYGVSFSVADRSALEGQAREQAVANARARADALAQLAGVTVDVPLSITEGFGHVEPVFYGRDEIGAGQGGAGPVPVQTGQIQINLQVTVTYLVN